MKQVNTGVKIAATTEIPTAYNLARYGEFGGAAGDNGFAYFDDAFLAV